MHRGLSVIQVDSGDVHELVAAVDRRGVGSITYEDFEAVMAASMLQTASPADDTPSMSSTVRLASSAGAMPFHEVSLKVLLPPMHTHTLSC